MFFDEYIEIILKKEGKPLHHKIVAKKIVEEGLVEGFESRDGSTYQDFFNEKFDLFISDKINPKIINKDGILHLNEDYKDPKELIDDSSIWIEHDYYDVLDSKAIYYRNFDDVEEYLLAIPKKKWDEFFDLIPRMEIEENYTYPKSEDDKSPFTRTNKLYNDFYSLFYETGLYIRFYWHNWEYGRTIANDLEKLKKERFPHLPMLLTAMVRNDRYCEGVLLAHLQEKFVLNIIKAMKYKYYLEWDNRNR